MIKKFLLTAVAALACAVPAAQATSPAQPGPIDESGSINGANYRIIVPADWNGALVLLAHGYRDRADHAGETDDHSAMDADFTGIAMGLAGQGYAVAASAYKTNGWAVSDELEDTVALTNYFKHSIAHYKRALVVGFSLGSFSGKLAEDGANMFDGFLPACGVLAGAPRAWDGAGVHLLAYQTAFAPVPGSPGSLPASWGTVADGDDDVDFETEVAGTIVGQQLVPANRGKFEFARLVTGVPLSSTYYLPAGTGLLTNMFFQTEARGELERRAGGPVVQNLDHVYALSPADKAYLMTLGVPMTTTDAWLVRMNATHYSAPAASRSYLDQWTDFGGKIKEPVLTMHTKIDTLVPVNHESKYLETVTAAKREENLYQTFTNGDQHCGFTAQQIFTAIGALDSWVVTGVAPTAASFPEALGFDNAFTPPAWPQP